MKFKEELNNVKIAKKVARDALIDVKLVIKRELCTARNCEFNFTNPIQF